MASLLVLLQAILLSSLITPAVPKFYRLIWNVTKGQIELLADEGHFYFPTDTDNKQKIPGTGLTCHADNWRQTQICEASTKPSAKALDDLKKTSAWCCMMARQPWIYTAFTCQHKVMCKSSSDRCLYHPMALTEHNVWEMGSEWSDTEDRHAVGIDFDGCVEGKSKFKEPKCDGDNCYCHNDKCTVKGFVEEILKQWNHCAYEISSEFKFTEDNRNYKVIRCKDDRQGCRYDVTGSTTKTYKLAKNGRCVDVSSKPKCSSKSTCECPSNNCKATEFDTLLKTGPPGPGPEPEDTTKKTKTTTTAKPPKTTTTAKPAKTKTTTKSSGKTTTTAEEPPVVEPGETTKESERTTKAVEDSTTPQQGGTTDEGSQSTGSTAEPTTTQPWTGATRTQVEYYDTDAAVHITQADIQLISTLILILSLLYFRL